MRSRNTPLYVRSLADTQQNQRENRDPFAEVQLDKVLKELSFIRIQLDEVVVPSANAQIQKLCNTGQLYGFQLEYSFPSLDVVSKALKATVRIPEKFMTATKIEFKHKRVVLLTMHEDQVAHWQRSRLTMHLLIQMSINGKHTTRPLAKCSIPLYELVVAPYLICRDFDFVGTDFEATALVRIDLGSRVKALMERLEVLRGDRSREDTFVVTDRHREPPGRRTRSRSSSRCRAHSSTSLREEERENVAPRSRRPHSVTSSLPSTSTPIPITLPPPRKGSTQSFINNFESRPRIPSSSSSIGSDSVFVRPESTRKPTVSDVETPVTRTVSNSYGASTVGNVVEEVSRGGKYYMQLTVHEASGLPPVQDDDGRIIAPSSFISVLGREGDLRSPVIRNTRQPRWEFTARFAISSERKNLIVKVIHHGSTGDVPLGFVTIALPVANTRRAVFEMADVTRTDRFTSDVAMITLSMERIRNIDDDEEAEGIRRRNSSRTASSRGTQSSPPFLPRVDSPPIVESSEVIGRRMQRCMAELDTMVRNMGR